MAFLIVVEVFGLDLFFEVLVLTLMAKDYFFCSLVRSCLCSHNFSFFLPFFLASFAILLRGRANFGFLGLDFLE